MPGLMDLGSGGSTTSRPRGLLSMAPTAAAPPTDSQDAETAALEGELQRRGLMGLVREGVGAAAAAIDLIERPYYAAMAVVKNPVPGVAGLAATNELLSGVPGTSFKGKKQGALEVAEELGFPRLGSLSETSLTRAAFSEAPAHASDIPIIGSIFTDTGTGLPLQRGGPLDIQVQPQTGGMLDITGRGAIFGPAGIPLDPASYISFGLGSAGEIGIRGSQSLAKTFISGKGERLLAEELASLAPGLRAGKIAAEAATPTGQEIIRKASEAAARSMAVDQAVPQVARDMVASGIESGTPLFRAVQDAARKEAEDRVLAAAAHVPGLLDKGGMKWLGKTIPGTPAIAAGVSGVSSAVVAKLSETAVGQWALKQVAGEGSAVANLIASAPAWSRDWRIRNLPGAKALKVGALDEAALLGAEWGQRLQDTGIGRFTANWTRGRFRTEAPALARIGRALDTGVTTGMTERELLTAGKLRSLDDDLRVQEIVRGIGEGGIENHFPHFYDNTPEEQQIIFNRAPSVVSGKVNLANLGRFNETRVFPTFDDAMDYWRREKVLRPWIPELKPVYDPIDAFQRRISGHALAMANDRYYQKIAETYGRSAVDAANDVRRAFSAVSSEYTGTLTAAQEAERAAVQRAAQTMAGPEFVKGLTQQGRREFLRLKLGGATSEEDLFRSLREYGQFWEDMPRRGTLQGELAPDGTPYVPAPLSNRWLDGTMLPQSLANDLVSAPRRAIVDSGKMLQSVDKFQNAMRTAVYANPAFVLPAQTRNKLSNVASGIAAIGFGYIWPTRHIQMVKILAGMDGALVTRLGERYTYDEIRRDIMELGIKQPGRVLIEQTRPVGEVLQRGDLLTHKIAAATENSDRVALYLSYLNGGHTRQDAADLTKQWLLDYADIGPNHQKILRRLFLFPTYAQKTVVNMARLLKNNPGRAAVLYGHLLSGRPSEDAGMTTWEGNAQKIRLDRNGKDLTVLTGIDLPVRQLDLLWRGTLKRTGQGIGGMLGPFVKMPIEAMTGTNLFTGRQFTRKESDSVGRFLDHVGNKWLQQAVGYDKSLPDAAGRVHYTFDEERFHFLVESWILSRVVSTSDRQFRDYLSDKNYLPSLLDMTTGLRFKTLNLTEQERKKADERARLIRDAAIRAGIVKEGSYTYAPRQGASR